MLKKFYILVFIVGLLTQTEFCWGKNYDFRYTRWGMTKDEVISSEEKMDPVEVTDNIIKYKTQILGENVELHYEFVENNLLGAAYKLDDNYLNSQHFRNTYKKFKEALMKKYGQPSEETTNWRNATYKNLRKKWGLALSLGHVEYDSKWETQNTKIECSLKEVNHYVLCLIEYWSIEYSHLLEGSKKKDKPDEIKKSIKMDPL